MIRSSLALLLCLPFLLAVGGCGAPEPTASNKKRVAYRPRTGTNLPPVMVQLDGQEEKRRKPKTSQAKPTPKPSSQAEDPDFVPRGGFR